MSFYFINSKRDKTSNMSEQEKNVPDKEEVKGNELYKFIKILNFCPAFQSQEVFILAAGTLQ